MRCIIAGMMILLLGVNMYAQQNLVPNPGFELISSCPTTGGQIEYAENWDNIVTIGGGADLYNVCGPPLIVTIDTIPRMGVPENNRGYQETHSGNGYVGFYAVSDPESYPNWREFIQAPLIKPLHAGVRYEVKFYVSLADKFQYAVGSLGVHFSIEPLHEVAYDILPDVVPQIQSPVGIIYSDKENWMEIRDTLYIPRTEEAGQQWITIGNFLPDTLSQITFVDSGAGYGYDRSSYYIDDVSVVALDSVPNGVGIEEVERNDVFKVYPNPSNGLFTLSYNLNELEVGIVNVYDLVGKKVIAQSLNYNTSKTEMTLTDLNSGVYILQVDVSGENRFSERISILKQ